MNAMEKMVANMLGITPEQMHDTLSGLSSLATELKGKLDTILSQQEALSARMDEIAELARDTSDKSTAHHGDLLAMMDAHASNIAEGFRDLKGTTDGGHDRNDSNGNRAGSRGTGRKRGGGEPAPGSYAGSASAGSVGNE